MTTAAAPPRRLHARRWTLDQIPAEVVEAAKLHLLDTLGCGLAAHALDVAPDAREAMLEPGTAGPATVIGVEVRPARRRRRAGQRRHLPRARLRRHAHRRRSRTSASRSSPPRWPPRRRPGRSGADLVAAIVAGNEVVTRLGMAAGSRSTPAASTPPACSASSAPPPRRRACAGSTRRRPSRPSASPAAWRRASSSTSPTARRRSALHPGFAAHSAIVAVAPGGARGRPARRTVFEGRFGLYNAFLGRDDLPIDGAARRPRRALGDAADRLQALPRLPLRARLARRDRARSIADTPLSRDEIEEIVAITTEAGVSLVLEPLADKHRPRSEYDAKFSLPVLGRRAAAPRRGRRDDLHRRRDRRPSACSTSRGGSATRSRSTTTFPRALPGGVRIRTRDGRVLEAELPTSAAAPRTR